MQASLKITLVLLLAIAFMSGQVAKADTKVLRTINITISRFLSDETISLENDKDLVVKGFSVQRYEIPNDPGHVLKATIDYVGDKNGYRAKYVLMKDVSTLRLSPGALKSLAG